MATAMPRDTHCLLAEAQGNDQPPPGVPTQTDARGDMPPAATPWLTGGSCVPGRAEPTASRLTADLPRR